MEMDASAPASTAPVGATSSSRYDALLQQIVQLNTDLQKTAALSQALQRERDGLQENNGKLKEEAKRLHERCEKLQLVLMQETEHKIESDKKHEELISKWKRQLELKARAFENLQKKFAPPKDLEQLRLKIQEELEGPYQQRIESLQDEVETHRQMAFNFRREYELLKAEYEQFSSDQGEEMECIHATYEITINDLKKKLQMTDECARDSRNVEIIRRLEKQRDASTIEIKLLQEEVRDVRDEIMRVVDISERDKMEREIRLADEVAKSATLELDQKATGRQLNRLRDECESFRSKWDEAQTKLLQLSTENENLRDQIKQKDMLVFNSHNTLTKKLRDERSVWEKDQAVLKDRVNELMLKLQAAEATAQQVSVSAAQSKQNDANSTEHSLLLKTRDESIEKYRSLVTEMEKKVAEKEEMLRQCQLESEESIHKLQMDTERLQKMVETLEAEREHYVTKLTTSQELLSRMKSECVMMRTKLKEIENDYRDLQTKHRDVLQYQEDAQLAKEQMEAKIHVIQLKYVEQDYSLLAEKSEKEKENNLTTVRELQVRIAAKKCSILEADFRNQTAVLKHETRAALSKALRELSKTQKKRDAYKRKCMEIHERYKLLLEENSIQEAKLSQIKQNHSVELQLLLAQLSEAESDKTTLLQRQIELGFPVNTTSRKSLALRPTEETPITTKDQGTSQ